MHCNDHIVKRLMDKYMHALKAPAKSATMRHTEIRLRGKREKKLQQIVFFHA